MTSRKSIALAGKALAVVAGLAYATTAFAAAARQAPSGIKADPRRPPLFDRSTLPRTIITTDGEWDDQNSFIRLLYYANELDIAGLVYSSANHHWKGDGVHTLQQAKDAGVLNTFLGERNQGNPPQNSIDQKTWRWTGTAWMEEAVLDRYAEIYSNLVQHDPNFPTPAELWSKIEIGNVDFDSDMHADTPGSNLIKKAILDDDPRTLYLEAWGGTNTIARALKSIENEYKSSPGWPAIQAKVNKKVVIPALGLQDATYNDYIAKAWPNVVLIRMGGGPGCTAGHPNFYYCSAEYWTPLKYGNGRLIQNRSMFGDGSRHESEELITTNGIHNWEPGRAKDMANWRLYARQLPPPPVAANNATGGQGGGDPGFGGPGFGGLAGPNQRLDFAGEGDSPTFMFLLNTGLRGHTDVSLGGWGGRYLPSADNAALYVAQNDVDHEGRITRGYSTQRWIAEIQNDFAARIKWGVSANYADANHNPVAKVGADVTGKAGTTVRLKADVSDPDGDKVALNWIVYKDASTVSSPVTVRNPTSRTVSVAIPADAKKGQRIVMVLTATDNGRLYALSRYGQVVINVE